MQIMERPILVCDVAGAPADLETDNLRLLQTYVGNGGLICFVNTTDEEGARGFRGLIRNLIDESLVRPGQYTLKGKHYRWHGGDSRGVEVESGLYFYRAEAGLCRVTHPVRVSRLRKLPIGRHPVFSAYYRLSDIPSIGGQKLDFLPYEDRGVYGVIRDGRPVVLYTEGYFEREVFRPRRKDPERRQTLYRWLTNVVVYGLGQGSLGRPRLVPPITDP